MTPTDPVPPVVPFDDLDEPIIRRPTQLAGDRPRALPGWTQLYMGTAQALLGTATIVWSGTLGRGSSVWVLLGLYALIGASLLRGRSRRVQLPAVGALGLAVVGQLPVASFLEAEPLVRLGTVIAVLAAVGAVVLLRPWQPRGADRWMRVIAASALIAVAVLTAVTPLQILYLLTVGLGVTELVRGGLALLARRPGAGGGPGWRSAEQRPVEDVHALVTMLSFEGATARTRYARFLALMAFATILASLGVILDSTAVVIGAMLVAPLMTPLMAVALSLGMGWPRRAGRAALVGASGILLAIALAALLSAAVPIPLTLESNPQITARIAPTLLDLFIALAAGGAGAFALSRSDVSDALPGVAVAISLVPPLTVVGIAVQNGDLNAAFGALLLFTTNLVSILVAGVTVFVATGVIPIHLLTQRTRWARTTAAVLTIGLTIVVAGLVAVGQRIVLSGAQQRLAIETTEAWLDGAVDGLRLDAVDVTGADVEVRTTGQVPEDLDVTDLEDQLSAALDREVDVEVVVIPEYRWGDDGAPSG